jgi:hypothetical protein
MGEEKLMVGDDDHPCQTLVRLGTEAATHDQLDTAGGQRCEESLEHSGLTVLVERTENRLMGVEDIRDHSGDFPSGAAEPESQVADEVPVQWLGFVGLISPQPLLAGIPAICPELESVGERVETAELNLMIGY